MTALKSKLINWSHNQLSLAGRILVANQVLLASMWYIAACWNPNPRMITQIRSVVRNFIWGGKDAPARTKVKWDTLTFSTTQGGLGIIDPKAQSEALLAKLFIRGLAPGGEPWKELIQHKADQTRLPVHSKGPNITDVNWIFAAPKVKRVPCSMWKSIIGAWMNVRPSLTKEKPSNIAEIFRQPIFGNPLILNKSGIPLGLGGSRDESAFARAGCSRTKDLWNLETQTWKSLRELGMSYHASNRQYKEAIIASIPWRLAESSYTPKESDWISNPTPPSRALLDWLYFVLSVLPGQAKAIEFKRSVHSGHIQASTNQTITIATDNLFPVRILAQERPGAHFKIAKELKTLDKKTPIF